MDRSVRHINAGRCYHQCSNLFSSEHNDFGGFILCNCSTSTSVPCQSSYLTRFSTWHSSRSLLWCHCCQSIPPAGRALSSKVCCYDATASPSLIAFTRRLNTMLFSHSLHLWQSDSHSYPAWSCRRLYFFPVVKCSWRFFWLHGTRILILVYNNNNNNAGTDKQTDGWQKHGPYCTYHVSIVNCASLPINHSAQQTLYVILATQQIQSDQFPQDIHDMHF